MALPSQQAARCIGSVEGRHLPVRRSSPGRCCMAAGCLPGAAPAGRGAWLAESFSESSATWIQSLSQRCDGAAWEGATCQVRIGALWTVCGQDHPHPLLALRCLAPSSQQVMCVLEGCDFMSDPVDLRACTRFFPTCYMYCRFFPRFPRKKQRGGCVPDPGSCINEISIKPYPLIMHAVLDEYTVGIPSCSSVPRNKTNVSQSNRTISAFGRREQLDFHALPCVLDQAASKSSAAVGSYPFDNDR